MSFETRIGSGQVYAFPYSFFNAEDPVLVTITTTDKDGKIVNSNAQIVTGDDPLPEDPDGLVIWNTSGDDHLVVVTVQSNVSQTEYQIAEVFTPDDYITVVIFDSPLTRAIVLTVIQRH